MCIGIYDDGFLLFKPNFYAKKRLKYAKNFGKCRFIPQFSKSIILK